MRARSFLFGGGLLMISIVPVFAENFTAMVVSYDPALRTIVFDDLSQLADIPATVAVPDIRKGDMVTVDFDADDNGYEAINSITIKNRGVGPASTRKKSS